MGGELGVQTGFITRIAVDICPSSLAYIHLLLRLRRPGDESRIEGRRSAPAEPSGVIVPSLTLTGCWVWSKCASPCPFPPATSPYCFLPQPRLPQVRQSQRFSFRSQDPQCARPVGPSAPLSQQDKGESGKTRKGKQTNQMERSDRWQAARDKVYARMG
jgi:hypothetical protein